MEICSKQDTQGGFDLPYVRGFLLLRVTINHGSKLDGLHTSGLGFKMWAWFSTGALDIE